MPINATQAVRELISYTIVTDKQSLVKLLERNGISLPSDPSDKDVTIAVLLASTKSPNFKNELSKLLTSKVTEASGQFSNLVGDSEDFGFTGVDDLGYVGNEDFFNVAGVLTSSFTKNLSDASKKAQQTSASSTKANKPKTKVGNAISSIGRFFKDNILTADNVNAGLQLGLTTMNNKIQGRQNAVQSEALILQQQQDEIRNQVGGKKGISTNTIIIGVVGLALVGTIIYVLTKKK
jgi:hypothetical protein